MSKQETQDIQAVNAENGTASQAGVRRISRKTRLKCLFNWLFFAHSCYNYERLQGTGFLYAMSPVIDELYDKNDTKGRSEALQRHTAFFNTEVRTGSAIVGLCAATEERIVSGESELATDMLPSVKYGLMGPLSGIGDTFIQAILSPLLLSVALGLAEGGNVLGPIFYFVVFVAALALLGIWSFNLGYKRGDAALMNFIESGLINKVISGAGIMGCTVMGALVAKYVTLNSIVSFELKTGLFDLQAGLFDAIMPQMIPLILTLVVYRFMDKKGVSALKMMLIIILGVAVLGLFRIV